MARPTEPTSRMVHSGRAPPRRSRSPAARVPKDARSQSAARRGPKSSPSRSPAPRVPKDAAAPVSPAPAAAPAVAPPSAPKPRTNNVTASAKPSRALSSLTPAWWGRGLGWASRVAIAWFALDALTHFVIEGSYLWLAFTPGGAAQASGPFASMWREYGRADARWATYLDAAVVSVELPTVFLMGPGAVLCAVGVALGAAWAPLAMAWVCWTELIGGWYTFAGPWLGDFKGEPSPLNTSDPLLLWVHLCFMNLLWVWVPAILLADAGLTMTRAVRKQLEGRRRKGTTASDEDEHEAAAAPPRPAAKRRAGPGAVLSLNDAWYTVIAASMAAYVVLVPTALALGKPGGPLAK